MNPEIDFDKLLQCGYIITDFKTIYLKGEHNSHYHTFSLTPSAGGSHAHAGPGLGSLNCGWGEGAVHNHGSGGNSAAATHTHLFSGVTSTESATDLNHTHSISITSAGEASHTHGAAAVAGGGCSSPGGLYVCAGAPHGHTLPTSGAGASHTHSLSGNTGTGSGTLQEHTHPISLTSAAGGTHYHASGNSSADYCWGYVTHAHAAGNYGNEAAHTHSVSGNTASGGEPGQTITPSSISQPITYGTPEVIITSALIIQPSSILQVVAIGTPILRYPQTISPQSISQSIAYGTPGVGIFGIIVPQSIIQQISIGSPTILKYVWHVILDGQYATETPEVNRAYIIGRDQYGNPVYGTAVDATEGALVGERLDFQQDCAIPLTAQAAEVAAAILSKMRITGKKGLILIPPNCGQELFDVVQITDSGANQSAVKFRVVGIRFEYNPRQARYEHKLILGAL
jgi:hypothetical protein